MKKILSLAIAAALVAPVAVMADAVVYGKVRMSVDYEDYGAGNLFDQAFDDLTDRDAASVRDDSQFAIKSHASRLGIKGSEDLGNGLKGIYKMEFGVDIAGSQSDEFSPDNPISARNAYVGLAGNFGTVLIGRHDTPMKMSTGRLDYFADTSADFNGEIGYQNVNYSQYGYRHAADFSDRRADGTIAYVSPNWSGLTLTGAVIPGENSEANSLADAYSLAGMYENGGIYLAAAYEAADGETDLLNVTAEPGDHSQWRLGGGYDAGAWKVAAVYENEAIDTVAGNDWSDVDRWNISGAVTLGMGEIKGTYFDWEDSVTDVTGSGFSLGYDYNLSKRSQMYVLYHDSTIEATGFDDGDLQIVSVGVNHTF